MIKMLTKPNCPHCQALKLFLKHAMNDKYAPDIEIYDQGEQADVVQTLLDQNNIQAFPSLIAASGETLSGFQPSAVMNFLEKHIGKK
jgi:glutaredoxin-like protein NrdH